MLKVWGRRSSLNVQKVLYERLKERAAYRQHVMVPFEELRGRLDY